MRTSYLALMLAAVLQCSAGLAQAQHYPLQHFDDLTFAAMADARALHWEIYNDFTNSQDRNHLLEDVQHLMADLQGLQRSIMQQRSPRMLDRELDAAIAHLVELREHLQGCDFAMHRHGQYQGNASGYTFSPQTIHPGNIHVNEALKMLNGIEQKLTELHVELTSIPVSQPGPQLPGFPAPQMQPPVYQSPQGPVYLPAPQSKVYGPTFTVENGKIRFQIRK